MEETKDPDELRAIARSIIAANQFMTLATAAGNGKPWASPVWYAPLEHRQFYWVSSPDAQHSRNLAVRPELAFVVFDYPPDGRLERGLRPGDGRAARRRR